MPRPPQPKPTDPRGYYRAVPGSRELITAGLEETPELLVLDALQPDAAGILPRLAAAGETLGGARPEGEGFTAPWSVFDRLAPLQEPLEQAVYFHLFRLAYGEGRNYCWAGKRELMRRAGLSERRLQVALTGLVEKGHLKPLARHNRGTLYRVYLPAEVLEGRAEPGVRVGGLLSDKEVANYIDSILKSRKSPSVPPAARPASAPLPPPSRRAVPGPGGHAPRGRTARVSVQEFQADSRERSGPGPVSRSGKGAKSGRTSPGIEKLKKEESTKNVPSMPKSRTAPAPRPAAGTRPSRASRPAPESPGRQRPLESPLNEERFAAAPGAVGPAGPAITVGAMAEAFFAAAGVKPSAEERDAALSELTGLLEDGFQRAEILRAAEWYGKKFPGERRLDRLAYYIHQALED